MGDKWRWFVLVVFVGGRVSVGGVCNEEWLGIVDMCKRRSWFFLWLGAVVRVQRVRSLRLYRCFAPAGEVGVVDEGGVKGAGSRSRGLVTVLLGGRGRWMVPF